MTSEYLTVKISKSTFEQLKEYRDNNKLKSMTIAIQNGMDCLMNIKEINAELNNARKKFGEEKEKSEYCEMQEILIEIMIKDTIINWVKTVDEDRADNSIQLILQSFEKTVEKFENPKYDCYENKEKILPLILKKYIKIIKETIDTKDINSKIKNEMSNMLLEHLITFDDIFTKPPIKP